MGAEAALRQRLCCATGSCRGFQLDALGGYRFFSLEDRLSITENLFPVDPGSVPGTNISLRDSFRTCNRFHGGSLGLSFFGWRGAWSVEANAKMDLGAMQNRVDISGATRIAVPGDTTTVTPGGLLTQITNLGCHSSSRFTVIPEMDLRLGYQPFHHVRFTLGYSFILLTGLARAGEQIDPRVNINLLPPNPMPGVGPANPTFSLHRSDAWLQGLTAGVEIFF
jgi:hypothetical protein